MGSQEGDRRWSPDADPALAIAVAISIVDVVSRSARPHDAVLGHVPRLDRWADVELRRSARVAPGVLVFDAETVTSIDTSGLGALREIIAFVRAAGVEFTLARAHGTVLDELERDGCLELIGPNHLFSNLSLAVEASS